MQARRGVGAVTKQFVYLSCHIATKWRRGQLHVGRRTGKIYFSCTAGNTPHTVFRALFRIPILSCCFCVSCVVFTRREETDLPDVLGNTCESTSILGGGLDGSLGGRQGGNLGGSLGWGGGDLGGGLGGSLGRLRAEAFNTGITALCRRPFIRVEVEFFGGNFVGASRGLAARIPVFQCDVIVYHRCLFLFPTALADNIPTALAASTHLSKLSILTAQLLFCGGGNHVSDLQMHGIELTLTLQSAVEV